MYAERGGTGGRKSIDEFMEGPGALLRHRPDLVLAGFDGPNTYTVIDIKTLDTAGPAHNTDHHTDTRRLGAHIWARDHCLRSDYQNMIPPRMRLVVIVISSFGSFGGDAQPFFSELGRRVGSCVPMSLLDEATWAAPRFAPFIRMALGCSVRRGLADYVWRKWRRVPRHPPPPPPPLPPHPAQRSPLSPALVRPAPILPGPPAAQPLGPIPHDVVAAAVFGAAPS